MDQNLSEQTIVPVNEEYLKLSLQGSKKSSVIQNQLLILDLNGTLCSRTTTKSFYTRPHSNEFFEYIFKNFTVMVWSSAQANSVEKMCKMFAPYKPSIIWHRSHLGLSHTDFHSNVKSVKNLEKVWAAHPIFNATNTMVLDDTPFKLCAQPYNLVLMRTFDHTDFALQNQGERDLRKVIKYLTLLQYQTNVCNYIRFSPFNAALDWGILPDPVADKIIDQFVNGKNVNSDTGRLLKMKRDAFSQELDQLIAGSKKKQKHKALESSSTEENDAQETRSNRSNKTIFSNFLDHIYKGRNFFGLSSREATDASDVSDGKLQITEEPIEKSQMSEESSEVLTVTENNIPETNHSVESKTHNEYEFDVQRNNEHESDVQRNKEYESDVQRNNKYESDVQRNNEYESDMERSSGYTSNIEITQEIMPNPFEAEYNMAFPTQIGSQNITACKKSPKVSPKVASKLSPMETHTKSLTPSPTPSLPQPQSQAKTKAKQKNKAKKAKKKALKKNKAAITIQAPSNVPSKSILKPPPPKPLKSILKAPKSENRIIPGSLMTKKEREKLERNFESIKESKRLRREKKEENRGAL